MKNNLILISIFCLTTFCSIAQTEKGSIIVGGTAGFSSYKDKSKNGGTTVDNYKYLEGYISPNLGIFIIDKLAVGGKLDIVLSSQKWQNSDNKDRSSLFTIGPWARYYFPLGTKAAVFGEASTGLGVLGHKNTSVDILGRVTTTKDPSRGILKFGIGPGFTYFVNKNVGLEATLLYNLYRSAYKGNDDVRRVYTTSGIYFNIGFQIYL